MADALPVWAVADVAVLPVRVQPVKPCSNPPLVIPLVGAGVTVSETVVLCVALGDVPVTVIGYVPGVVVASTLNVSVELEPVVTEDGFRLVLVPDGAPVAVSEMVSAAPLVIAVEIVEVPEPPWATETLDGFAAIEKSFGGGVPPHPGSVNVPIRVCQLKVPFAGMYSFVYQNVQPSTGSTVIAL